MVRLSSPVTFQVFHLPKRGHTNEEYEDAFAADAETRRFAIADGASESSYAAQWARLLVEGFLDPRIRPDRATGWVEALQRRWSETVDALALPWYAEAKREQGAFATFLGLQLQGRAPERGSWRALAVGDSCLFQIREQELLAAFPLARSADFGNQPCLLGSRTTAQALEQHQQKRRGRWQTGDRFLLMTDALSQWFLRQCERDEKPCQALDRFLTEPFQSSGETPNRGAFAAWIEERRAGDDLRNDDVTLIDIRV